MDAEREEINRGGERTEETEGCREREAVREGGEI